MKYILTEVVEKNTLIIVFANNKYLRVVENWISAVSLFGLNNYVIISMDQLIYEQLNKKNIPTILRPCDIQLGNIWIHRINVIREILGYGFDIVHSDADAIWLKNPLNKFIYEQPYDMIFSQGTYWPMHVYKALKFVLCCGFFYLKANSRTMQFIDDVAEDVINSKDDQVSCNEYLLKNNFKWKLPDNNYIMSFKNNDFICSNNLIVGGNELLKLAVLPHSKFQRVPDDDSDVYVKHIVSEKKSDSIVNVLKKNNCWFLNDTNGRKEL